jgi:phosphoribosyl 1,2-cyclic phosphate phosphodiesterase
MKITILGCGGAQGVPTVCTGWGNCDPANPKNRRRRPSILVEAKGQTILVDTSPDLRSQLLDAEVCRLDAVLYTHAHADHVHGIDDLREINRAMQAPIPAFGSPATLREIAGRFAYVFASHDFATQQTFKPCLVATPVEGPFTVGPLDIVPFDQDHGYCRSTGYRFGAAAYSTDVLELPETSLKLLENLDLWIVGCLVDVPHPTHAHIDKALAWVERLRPKLTVITHMSRRLDYTALSASLPTGVIAAYDGLVLEV